LQPAVIRTPIERYRDRWNHETSPDSKNTILKDLFLKHYLSVDEVTLSSSETLKFVVFGILELGVSPSDEDEMRNLTHNITAIGTELLTRRSIPILPHEKTLLEMHLNHTIMIPASIRHSSMVSSSSSMGSIEQYASSETTIDIFKQHPVQWLFHVLKPRIDLWDIHLWSDFIHPQVLVLCYKSCMTTTELLDNIIVALKNKGFSEKEHKTLQRNLLDLLSTWLRSRYYVKELGNHEVKIRFDAIFQLFYTIPDETIHGEFEFLKEQHKHSQNITPRDRFSLSLESFEMFLKKIETCKKEGFHDWCKILVYEITAYYMGFLVSVPVEEFFFDLKDKKTTSNFSELVQSENHLESFLTASLKGVAKTHKIKLFEALIQSIKIACDDRLYQTAFSLKIVLETLFPDHLLISLSESIEKEWKAIRTLFEVSCNFNMLRTRYQNHDKQCQGYFPTLFLISKDLTITTENIPVTIQIQGIHIFNIHRMNVIFNTLSPLLKFSNLSGVYIPKTNLPITVARASLQEGPSSSSARAPRASRSQSLPPPAQPER
jgi:hypothetical protein